MILKDKASNGSDMHHQQSSHPNKDMDEDEIILAEDKTNEGDVGSFDAIIGCIEDIVIDQKFQDMQEELLRSHCDEFDETSEENKLVYTEIYQLYTSAVEDFIEAELEKRVPDFRMKDFVKDLEAKRAELDGEVFEMLFTLTDFLAFKEMMIDFKMMRNSGALDELLSIRRISGSLE